MTVDVTIISYGTGNIASLQDALSSVGASSRMASTAVEVRAAEALLLPGVGHFGAAVRHLDRCGMRDALLERIGAGVPVLGICLGFQLLTRGSAEDDRVDGLGVFELFTERMSPSPGHKVPHIGWNTVAEGGTPSTLLLGVPPERRLFYFANAYAVGPAPVTAVRGCTYAHDRTYLAVAEQGRVYGVQFHPEKSRSQGLRVLRNFLEG